MVTPPATDPAPGTPSRPPPRGLFGLYLKVMIGFAGLSTGAIVTIMLVQIVARYVFNASLIWAEEMCRYILVWQTFALIGIAFHQGELAILDLLSGRFPPKVLFVLRTAVTLPVAYFLVLLIWHGWTNAGRFSRQVIPAVDFIWVSLTGGPLGATVFWIYVAVPFGCTILLLHLGFGLFEQGRRAFLPEASGGAA